MHRSADGRTDNPTTAELEEEIRGVLNEIVDPCSAAAGVPVGLVDMGIVRNVEINGSALRIVLLPTFPTCRFVPIFELEVRKRLGDVDLSVNVEVAGPDVVWDESDMVPDARRRLEESRRRRRNELLAKPRLAALPLVDAGKAAEQA